MSMLHLLWDESHIWGLLAARAVEAMDLPRRLVRGRDIASGLLERERPNLLFVPGGSARHKAKCLGVSGMEALRCYVENGGQYFGFCGGAGLALSQRAGAGLGLCPWQRGSFEDRIQHFMSGHLHVALAPDRQELAGLIPEELPESPCLPVWWPGRFAPKPGADIHILASYERPAADFWLADLPIAALPPDTFSTWQDMYGLSFTPGFLSGQPCLLYGLHGKGGYLLSYSHLETPDSPEANLWLAHLLRCLAGLDPVQERLPAWPMEARDMFWEDATLARMQAQLDQVLQTGLQHGLLFERTNWLMGWRAGIPGANLNNLWACLRVLRDKKPGNVALTYWKAHKASLAPAFALFCEACIQYFLAERLSLTLSKFLPGAVPPEFLKEQRESLFGPPMQAGGLYREIMEPLDELAFLLLSEEWSR